MKPGPFVYHRARSVDDAVRLLAELGDDAKVLAGGQSLIPMAAFRLARPTHVIDIGGLDELRYFKFDAGGLSIGALVTHSEVELCRDPKFLASWQVLARSMKLLGHFPIRTRGTVGGSIAHGDAVAEWCILSVLLSAEVRVVGPLGQRTIAISDFLRGFYSTALGADEIIVEVHFPVAAPRAALVEFAERHGDFALVASAVALDLDGQMISGARVVLAGTGEVPQRVTSVEAALEGRRVDEPNLFSDMGELTRKSVSPSADHLASAEYRRGLAGNLVTRACQQAVAS